MMQAAMIPMSMLDERRRLGHDRFDEVWEGVLHLVPLPATRHQRIVRDLTFALRTPSERRGLVLFTQTGLYEPTVHDDSDYRGPDLLLVEPRYVSKRGVEGHARLVIEVISPHDESRDKLPFYARIGVTEVWLLDPQHASIEILAGTKSITTSGIGMELRIEGSDLVIRDGSETYTVDLRDVD